MEDRKLTVTVEGEAAVKLLELAEASGRAPDFYVTFLIEEYAKREMRIIDQLKQGLESVRAGNTIPHETVMAEMDQIIAAGKAGKRAKRSAA